MVIMFQGTSSHREVFCKSCCSTTTFVNLSRPSEKSVRGFILVVYLLIPPAYSFTKRWTPGQMIHKLFDHWTRELFCRTQFGGCRWLVKIANLLSEQNISFTPNGNWKNHAAANCVSRATHIRWMEIRLYISVDALFVTSASQFSV